MQDYLDEAWRATLARHGLADFEGLWHLEAPWFEEPNRRRNGWSGVARLDFGQPGAAAVVVFLKRQENHNTFSWRHPLRGIPTLLREFRHIMHYRACQVPTLEPVFFAARTVAGKSRAILVTQGLTGFLPLDHWLAEDAPRPLGQRRTCLVAVARLLSSMHRHGIQHNCFFPKHVFVRAAANNTMEARVIDLEKSRWRPLALPCALRDLDTLNRHSPGWSRTDRMRFLLTYLGSKRMTPYGKWLWRRLVARAARKHKARTGAA